MKLKVAIVAGLLGVLAVAGYYGGRSLLFQHHLRELRSAMEDQDCDEARPHLDACLRLRPDDAEVHFVAARGFRRAGLYDDAADHLGKCQSLAGQTDDIVLEWAMLHAAEGDLPQNERFLQQRLDAGAPESNLILEALAQGSIHVYNIGGAGHYLDLLLARDPDSALGLMYKGWLYEMRGHLGSALENYRRAVQVRPRQPAVRLRLVQVALRHRDTTDLEEHLDNLRRRNYKRPEVLLALAEYRIQQNDLAQGRALLDELLAESPDVGAALVERGKLALQDGDAAAAERWLRHAVELAPQDRMALNFLVQALAQQGKTAQSSEYASQLKHIETELAKLETLYKKMSESPADASLRHQAAVICLRNGQDEEALRWLTGALQIDPFYGPAHEALAEYLERAGEPMLAAQHRRIAAVAKRR